jgi:hypothetical protein
VLFVFLFLFSGVTGCQNHDQPSLPKASSTDSHPTKQKNMIVVPPYVAGKWKTVRIAVVDKSSVSEKVYAIPIGGKLVIPGSSMTIKVETFLPSFIMEGSTMTSISNDLTNPGVKIQIIENGSELFSGWLFSKFPSTHAFIHPKYGFALIDAQPADK